MQRKFKYGDCVIVPCVSIFGWVFGHIIKFSEEKQMYIMTSFFDAAEPEEGWEWIYVHERRH